MTRPRIELSSGLRTRSADEPGSWEPLLAHARMLDECGVDRIVASEHVVLGERLEEYGRAEIGGTIGGKQPTGPDGHWLDPLVTLSVLVGMTRRVRLATGILLAALRRPVVLAKTAATLDVLSGGRLDLGVGVGWQREEYEAAVLPFEGRGRLLDHTLEVCQVLWRERRAHYDAPELSFEAIHSMPKPLQPGGVPIWVSGTVNPRVVQRLARFGVGWIPWGPDAADARGGILRMREALEGIGHDASDLQVMGHLPLVATTDGSIDIARTIDAVPDLLDAGVTDVRVPFAQMPDAPESRDELRSFVTAFRSVVGRSSDPIT